MAVRSLNRLRLLRLFAAAARRRWLWLRHGVRIDGTTSISMTSRVVSGARGSIHVGPDSLIAFKTLLLSRRPDGTSAPIVVGRNCFIGGGSVLLPG